MRGDRVAPRLYVGPAPQPNDDLGNVDILVMAAVEIRAPRQLRNFRGAILNCGIEDDWRGIGDKEKAKIVLAARTVAKALYSGKTVLCTCHMGWNRSSLVAACALKLCTGLALDDIVARIRDARGEDALSNPSFVEFLYAEAPAG